MTVLGRLRRHITRRRLHPPLGFVHIPKAGGTGMLASLDAALRPRRIAYALDRTQFGGFTGFDSMSVGIRNGIVFDPMTMPVDVDLIAGHVAPSTILRRAPDARLMVILREPQSRLLSHWFYWRGYSDEVLNNYGDWGLIMARSRYDLADYLLQPALACVNDNILLRMLLWPHPDIPAAGFINDNDSRSLLDAARAQLERFAFVDAVENPDMDRRISVWLARTYGRSLWARLAGFRVLPQTRVNSAKLSDLSDTAVSVQMTEKAQTLLERHCRLDSILWRDQIATLLPNQDAKVLALESLKATIMRYDALGK